MNSIKLRIAAVAALLAAAGCGGGSGDLDRQAEDAATVPQSALASAAAFSRWVGSRPTSDTSEPLSVAGVMPPVSDSDDPIDLN